MTTTFETDPGYGKRSFSRAIPYILLFLSIVPILVGYAWVIIATFSVRTHGLMPVDAHGNFGGFTLQNWSFLTDPRIWIDGEEQDRISVLDRGFLFGDSVYEVVRTARGRLVHLEAHLDRLEASAARIRLRWPVSRDQLREEIEEAVFRGGHPETYVRVVLTRGSGDLELLPDPALRPCRVLLVDRFRPFPASLYREGCRLAALEETAP